MHNFFHYKRTAFFGLLYLIAFFFFLLVSQIVVGQNQTMNFENTTGSELISGENTFAIRSEVVDLEGNKCWQINDQEGDFGSMEIQSGMFMPVAFDIRRPWGEFDAIITGYNGKKKVLYQKITVLSDFRKVKFEAKPVTRITIQSLKKYNQLYIDNFEYSPISQSSKKGKKVTDKKPELFTLSFESNRTKFIENNHAFSISSSISASNASDSLRSWECADAEGTTGILEVKKGKISINSLKIKRPWGKYKAKITGFDGTEKIFTKSIRVGNEFSKIKLSSKKITRLEIKSTKIYNQLYIDEVKYAYYKEEEKTPNTEPIIVEKEIKKSTTDSLNNTNLVSSNNLESKEEIEPYQISEENLTLNFENVKLHSTDFQLNGHFFQVNSQVFEGHARSGKRAWQANENDGTSGYLKMKDQDFDLFSMWIKRPWGKFQAIVSAYQNGEKKYEKMISVNSEYQKVMFNNWHQIDEVRVESVKKFNQIYLDDIVYAISSGKNISQNIDNEEENSEESTTIEEIFAENPKNVSNTDLVRGESEENKIQSTENQKLKFELPEGKVDLAPEIFEFGNRYFGQRFKLAERTVTGTRLAWEVLGGSAQMIGTNEIELTGTDSVILRVSDENGASWNTRFAVEKAVQVIKIDPIPNVTVEDEAAEILATLSSGLLPKIEIIEGPAEVYGDAVILDKKPGKVRLKIYHPGNEFYHAVEPVEKSFYVGRKSQNITFARISHNLDGSPFKIRAVADSGLPVEFEIISGDAELDGTTIKPKEQVQNGKKNCIIIKAYQGGNSEYEPAPDVEKRFYIKSKLETKKKMK